MRFLVLESLAAWTRNQHAVDQQHDQQCHDGIDAAERHMQQRDGTKLSEQDQRPKPRNVRESAGYPESRRFSAALGKAQRHRKISGPG